MSQHATVEVLSNGTQIPYQGINSEVESYTNIEVAVTVTFVTAWMQVRSNIFFFFVFNFCMKWIWIHFSFD